jgi:DNA repair exonuclease SbcCD nuclease subunit
MKIIHLADTHFRNLKFHQEYREVLEQMFETMREVQPDLIVHCGDIAHTKTNMTPELIDIISWFLTELSNIAETIVILGNHDGNIKNKDRLDAITPIISNLQNDKIKLLRDSCEYKKGNFVFNNHSIFDNKIIPISEPDKINIMLYHGVIKNAKTDKGWVFDTSEKQVGDIGGFDFCFLGDIHLMQYLDEDKRVAYCGSTIQQNHGELRKKGFLLWEIQDKDSYSSKYYTFVRKHPYITVEFSSEKELNNLQIPKASKIRLVSKKPLTSDKTKVIIDFVRTKYEPQSLTFIEKSIVKSKENNHKIDSDNLRELKVQEKFIRGFLKEYELSEDKIARILELNKTANAKRLSNEIYGRFMNDIRLNDDFNKTLKKALDERLKPKEKKKDGYIFKVSNRKNKKYDAYEYTLRSYK